MTPTCKNLRKLSSNNVFQKHGVLISKHTFLKSRLKKDELKSSTFDATTCSSWYKANQGPQGHQPSPTPRPQPQDARYTCPPQHHYPQRGIPGTPAITTSTPGPQGNQPSPAPRTPTLKPQHLNSLGSLGLRGGNVVGEGNSLGSLGSQKCLGEGGEWSVISKNSGWAGTTRCF